MWSLLWGRIQEANNVSRFRYSYVECPHKTEHIFNFGRGKWPGHEARRMGITFNGGRVKIFGAKPRVWRFYLSQRHWTAHPWTACSLALPCLALLHSWPALLNANIRILLILICFRIHFNKNSDRHLRWQTENYFTTEHISSASSLSNISTQPAVRSV